MIMYILFFIIAFVWLAFIIGYPIYKKLIKKENFNWFVYAVGANGLALALNIVNLIIKCFNLKL